MTKAKRFRKKNKTKKKASREEDALSRLSFLWSASHLMLTSDPELSQFYSWNIKKIGQRINLPLDKESVKREYCKRCSSLMIPGATGKAGTTKVRIASRRERHLVSTCGHCGNFRRFGTRYPRPRRKMRETDPT